MRLHKELFHAVNDLASTIGRNWFSRPPSVVQVGRVDLRLERGPVLQELPSRDREVAIKVLPAALARDPERIYVTGLVNQELLLQSEYLAAENRILRGKLNPPYQPAAPKVRNGTRESIFVFQSTPTLVISPRMGFVGFSPKGVLLHAKIKINRPFIDHNL